MTACAPQRSITSSRSSAARLVTAFALGMLAYRRSSRIPGQYTASASYAASPSLTHLHGMHAGTPPLPVHGLPSCSMHTMMQVAGCRVGPMQASLSTLHAAGMWSSIPHKGAGRMGLSARLVRSTCVSCVQPLASRSMPRSLTTLQPLRLMHSRPGQHCARAVSVSSPMLRFQYRERRFRVGVARTIAATPLSVSLHAVGEILALSSEKRIVSMSYMPSGQSDLRITVHASIGAAIEEAGGAPCIGLQRTSGSC